MTVIEHTKAADKKHGHELRCGDCIHFKTGPAHPNYPGLCKDNGKKTYTPICQVFTPDVTVLKNVATDTLVKVASIVNVCTAQQMRILAHVFGRKSWFDNAGLKWGEQMYFAVGDKNYLSNIVRGYLISVSRSGDELVLVSDMEGLQKKQATARMMRSSVMTQTQFEKLRKQLIKNDRIFAPSSRGIPSVMEILKMNKKQLAVYQKTLQNQPDNYVPPTIDTVPSKWLDKRVMKSIVDKYDKDAAAKKSKLKITKKGGNVTISSTR